MINYFVYMTIDFLSARSKNISATLRLSLRQSDGNSPFFSGLLEKRAAR